MFLFTVFAVVIGRLIVSTESMLPLNYNVKMDMINKVIDYERLPTTLFIKTCLTDANKLNVLKYKTKRQTTFIENTKFHLNPNINPNSVMFILDLDCDHSINFIRNVK